MLKRIIDSLREELAPLVRAELRASLEKPVRQELRQELLAAGMHDIERTSENTSFEERLAALLDQSLKQVSEVVRECSDRQLASLTLGQEQIAKQIAEGLKTPSKQEIQYPSTSPEQPALVANLAAEMSAKMEQSMNLRLAELHGTLREELEPRIREELEPQLRAALHDEVESEKQRLIEEATHETLLDYLLKKKWEGIGSFIETLPPRMRLEAKQTLREVLKPEVRDLLLTELRDAVRSDKNHQICKKVEEELRGSTAFHAIVSDRLRSEIFSEMQSDLQHPMSQSLIAEIRSDVTFRSTVAASLRTELAPLIRKELQDFLKPEVRQLLENQMLMPVLLGTDFNLEGTVAGVLRKNLAVGMNDMRSTILDEIWELSTTAILEALGAALMPVDADGELLDRAIRAATEAFGPKSTESSEKLASAVTAAIDVIAPAYSEDAVESWRYYARKAQDLIDDRLIPTSFESRRKLGIPEGFFRAVKTHTCDATKHVIQPGDFYVVMRGLRIALPLTRETAEDLVRRSAANEIPTDAAVRPPWDGIPFSSQASG